MTETTIKLEDGKTYRVKILEEVKPERKFKKYDVVYMWDANKSDKRLHFFGKYRKNGTYHIETINGLGYKHCELVTDIPNVRIPFNGTECPINRDLIVTVEYDPSNLCIRPAKECLWSEVTHYTIHA